MRARDFLEQACAIDDLGTNVPQMCQYVKVLLGQLPWGLEITTGLSKSLLPVSQLTRLLGKQWLNGEVLDEMLGIISQEMKQSSLDIKRTWVLGIEDVNTLIRLYL